MSLTSYRAAPPRAKDPRVGVRGETCEWVLRDPSICSCAPASMPGDDLLFHRLSDSTIGADWFHGRVRDGIGWGTDAIATRQWSRCVRTVIGSKIDARFAVLVFVSGVADDHPRVFDVLASQDCH